MAQLLSTTLTTREDGALRAMFEARKRVFIDLLKWDLQALDDRFEIDQFDDEHAQYLILMSATGGHLGSARLLQTTRPHILGSLFPELCDARAPQDPRTFEVTRFCLDRSLRSAERRAVRNQMVTALVRFALDTGIERYSAVAELGWFEQILSFGWDCAPLGTPVTHASGVISALEIRITPDTPAQLLNAGIWSPVVHVAPSCARAAVKG